MEKQFQISQKYYYSYSFFQAAALFSREAFKQKPDLNPRIMNRDYRSNVLGTIIFSVTFLESSINEFYDRITFGNDTDRNKIGKYSRLYEKLTFLWKNDKVKNFTILDKYQLALSTLEKDIFDTGIGPFQDIQALISFRNYLVHYKPESIAININDDVSNYCSSIEKKIRGRLIISDYWKNLDNSFPGKYLGAESAEWVLEKVKTFVNEFYNRIDIPYLHKCIIEKIEIK